MAHKLTSSSSYWDDGDCGWVGIDNGAQRYGDEALLRDGRDRLTVVSFVTDANANYSYDEACVVELDGRYFLAHTSGCSCPSPAETWEVVAAGTVEDVLSAWRGKGGPHGYLVERQPADADRLESEVRAYAALAG